MGDPFRIIPVATKQPFAAMSSRILGVEQGHADMLRDSLHRPLHDLRISLTDRCYLRCIYCMPREMFDDKHAYLTRNELLTFEEIEHLARIFIRFEVRKIRLTGGEPLLRHGIEQLIEKLASIQTATGAPVEIAMTTNEVMLAHKAQSLKDAGLRRITVSLDGLSNATFQRMSGSGVVDEIGVIAFMTHAFCNRCTRARLSTVTAPRCNRRSDRTRKKDRDVLH